MAHGHVAPGGIVAGIVVPGNNVHLLRPFEIIQPLVCAHQVRRHRGRFVVLPDGVPLQPEIIQDAVRHEAAVIDGYPRKRSLFTSKFSASLPRDPFAEGIWQHDLIPIVNVVAPEGQVPCLVQGFDRPIFFPQPDPERLFTVLAIAFPAVLIINVPAYHIFIASVALCQLCRQLLDKMPVHRAVGAGIVALSELVAAALIIHPRHLRITLRHPGRKGSRGGCQHDLLPRPCQRVHDRVQLVKIVNLLRRLEPGPGKYVDGGAVNPRLVKQLHVLLPDLPRPLFRVVVSAV